MHTHTHTLMHTHVHTCTHMYTHTHTHTHMYTHVHTHTHTHTHVHTCTHTHTHKHTQTHTHAGDRDGHKVTTVLATLGPPPDRQQEVSYTDLRIIGNGSFGVVYQARLLESNDMVAIKKVLQDKRFKVSLRSGTFDMGWDQLMYSNLTLEWNIR